MRSSHSLGRLRIVQVCGVLGGCAGVGKVLLVNLGVWCVDGAYRCGVSFNGTCRCVGWVCIGFAGVWGVVVGVQMWYMCWLGVQVCAEWLLTVCRCGKCVGWVCRCVGEYLMMLAGMVNVLVGCAGVRRVILQVWYMYWLGLQVCETSIGGSCSCGTNLWREYRGVGK